jgi:hypothetical protein
MGNSNYEFLKLAETMEIPAGIANRIYSYVEYGELGDLGLCCIIANDLGMYSAHSRPELDEHLWAIVRFVNQCMPPSIRGSWENSKRHRENKELANV